MTIKCKCGFVLSRYLEFVEQLIPIGMFIRNLLAMGVDVGFKKYTLDNLKKLPIALLF